MPAYTPDLPRGRAVVGEGFDDARLDTLLPALPVAWKGARIRYIGRLDRPYPGKTEAGADDYVDDRISSSGRWSIGSMLPCSTR